MRTCDEYQEMISAYIDNELADADTSKLFFHLGECAECREMMKSMLQLRSALHETELIERKKSEYVSIWKKKFAVSYPVAAVIALMMLISSLLYVQKLSQPPTIVEKTQTEYVYMTSFPPVYATVNSSNDIKSN